MADGAVGSARTIGAAGSVRGTVGHAGVQRVKPNR